MLRIDIAAAPENLPISVSDLKCLKEVLLRPEVLLSHNPLLRVVAGEANVVDVYNRPPSQCRQPFPKDEMCVASQPEGGPRLTRKKKPRRGHRQETRCQRL